MKRFKISKLRIFIMFSGLGLIAGLTAAEKGVGTYCLLCPVGFMQLTLGSRVVPVGMIAAVMAALILVYLLGRFFCSWLCPTTFIKTVFNRKEKTEVYSGKPKYLRYMPFVVLAGLLLASFMVQFPVFCLICPIGLLFGFIFAVFRLFHLFDPSLNLIIFPAILIAELLLFRKWCAYICPIAAVFILMRKIPLPKFALKADPATCLNAAGKKCMLCALKCPEGLELVKNDDAFKERCTLCMECRDNCPASSISLKKSE